LLSVSHASNRQHIITFLKSHHGLVSCEDIRTYMIAIPHLFGFLISPSRLTHVASWVNLPNFFVHKMLSYPGDNGPVAGGKPHSDNITENSATDLCPISWSSSLILLEIDLC
jgi:hypothetical protein